MEIDSIQTNSLEMGNQTIETFRPLWRRNAIINGNFDIWQRGASFAAMTDLTYTADRFYYSKGGTMVQTIAQNTTPPPTNNISNLVLQLSTQTADTSIAAGDWAGITYNAEGYDVSQFFNRTCTLSFWVKSWRTGTYSISFVNDNLDRSWISEYTINASNTWEKKSVQVDLNITGANWNWKDGIGLRITWVQACGSTYATSSFDQWVTGNYYGSTNQVNGVGSTSDDFYLSQVQFEASPEATDFEYYNFADELARCQRYYEKSYNYDTVAGATTDVGIVWHFNAQSNNNTMFVPVVFAVVKRATPTITFYDRVGNVGKVWHGANDEPGVANGTGQSGFGGGTSDTSDQRDLLFHWIADAEL